MFLNTNQPDQLIQVKSFISVFLFFDDLHLQIIESISPKASVQNSSAQWTIFLVTFSCK